VARRFHVTILSPLLSRLPVDNDDPLSRRDQALEFLDVSERVHAERMNSECTGDTTQDVYRLTNRSDSVVDTHLLIVVHGLPAKVSLTNKSGTTRAGEPYIRAFLRDGVLQPGAQIEQRFEFEGT